ncbi:MAG TPA: hypothetical protein DD740_05110 [Chryseobacterium sp.]|nr:hypothetical protein [Chryseobacterium sp.]
MKKISIIILILIINSCNSQDKDKTSRKLEKGSSRNNTESPINKKNMQTYTNEEFTQEEVLKYKKNKTDGGYQYTDINGSKVLETDDDFVLYRRDITPKNSLFTITSKKNYGLNTRLLEKMGLSKE